MSSYFNIWRKQWRLLSNINNLQRILNTQPYLIYTSQRANTYTHTTIYRESLYQYFLVQSSPCKPLISLEKKSLVQHWYAFGAPFVPICTNSRVGSHKSIAKSRVGKKWQRLPKYAPPGATIACSRGTPEGHHCPLPGPRYAILIYGHYSREDAAGAGQQGSGYLDPRCSLKGPCWSNMSNRYKWSLSQSWANVQSIDEWVFAH